mgnify:CR=1 FL=1
MQFNSFAYIIFFLIVYIVYRVSPQRFQNFILLIASYLFYAWWDVRFLFLIILSTVINYSCSVELLSNKINVKERIAFSAWIILAYFVFVVVQWDQAPIFREAPATLFSWSSLIAWREHWKPLLIVCVTTLVFNLIYPKISKLDEKRRRGLILFLGVGANLFILGFFKYYNFFIFFIFYFFFFFLFFFFFFFLKNLFVDFLKWLIHF